MGIADEFVRLYAPNVQLHNFDMRNKLSEDENLQLNWLATKTIRITIFLQNCFKALKAAKKLKKDPTVVAWTQAWDDVFIWYHIGPAIYTKSTDMCYICV